MKDPNYIPSGECPHTGYEMRSLKCANCKYNRVYDDVAFKYAPRENRTRGTYCLLGKKPTFLMDE